MYAGKCTHVSKLMNTYAYSYWVYRIKTKICLREKMLLFQNQEKHVGDAIRNWVWKKKNKR